MKFLLLSLALILLVSCSESSESGESSEESSYEKESGYGMPRIGFHRAVTLNYRFAHSYEDLTVNPNGNVEVLGDMPFFMFLNEGDKLEVMFYNDQDIKNISYLNFSSLVSGTIISELNSSILAHPSLKNIPAFERELTFNKDSESNQDLTDRVFIVETEEANLPMVSNSKTMVWLECTTSSRLKTCPEGKLKFHYKLISYNLSKII